MIQVGLVGVGPQWERFRPALTRLRQPIHVEAVYDPVFARAETAARDLDADPIQGISALARRGNVEAILVMDPAWTRTAVLPLLACQQKPVFFAPWPFSGRDRVNRRAPLHADSDNLIVPAMWRRFFPAAIRLQELFATEIGRPYEIEIDLAGRSTSTTTDRQRAATAATGSTLESLVGWLDFCRTLFRAFPISASVSQTPAPDDATAAADSFFEFRMEYPPLAASNESFDTSQANTGRIRTAKLTLRQTDSSKTDTATEFVQELLAGVRRPALVTPTILTADSSRPWVPDIRLSCERGGAELSSTTRISWQRTSAEPIRETLTADRSEEEIMLDIFCRRVVGGLVPVADLNDIIRPIQLVRSCVDL
jgi:predicted dehydrogenase